MKRSSRSVADRTKLTDCQCAPTSVNIPQSVEMAIELPLEAFLNDDRETDELSERLLSSSLPFSHAKCWVFRVRAGSHSRKTTDTFIFCVSGDEIEIVRLQGENSRGSDSIACTINILDPSHSLTFTPW